MLRPQLSLAGRAATRCLTAGMPGVPPAVLAAAASAAGNGLGGAAAVKAVSLGATAARTARRPISSSVVAVQGVAPPVAVAPRESLQPHRPDVLVVGGGIIGCSTAYHLALKGASVAVLDTRGIAAAQSSKSWGFCRQQGRDPRELDLMKESIDRWQGLEAELGHSVGWRQAGNLALCDSGKRYTHFRTWLPLAAERGLDTEMLDEKQVKELLPGLSGKWLGGVWTQSDGTADPASATRAFAHAAERRGVQFRLFSAPVQELQMNAAGTRVEGVRLEDGDVLSAGTTVLAAGSWTSELLRGHFSLPQLRVRATAARTERLADLDPALCSFPEMGVWAPRCSFRKRPDGSMTVADGGYAEEHEFEAYASVVHGWKYLPGYLGNPVRVNPVHDITHSRDPNPNPRRIDQAVKTFGRMFPALAPLRIAEVWAAHIDMTPDMVPVIDVGGPLPEGLVVSTGYSGHGLGVAPGAGRLTADLALSGRRPAEAQAFRADRFGEKLFWAPESVF